MSNGNFRNGSLVMRVWKAGGDCELLAKFQYWEDACDFAEAFISKAKNTAGWFTLAVCDNEVKVRTFLPPQKPEEVP